MSDFTASFPFRSFCGLYVDDGLAFFAILEDVILLGRHDIVCRADSIHDTSLETDLTVKFTERFDGDRLAVSVDRRCLPAISDWYAIKRIADSGIRYGFDTGHFIVIGFLFVDVLSSYRNIGTIFPDDCDQTISQIDSCRLENASPCRADIIKVIQHPVS